MKAPDIGYDCPLTLDDALSSLASEEIEFQPLAGGQSLLPMMHFRLAHPDVLLDLNKLVELDFIKDEGAHIHIGAMVRYSTLMRSETVRERIPLFSLALPHIAHEAIRNRGTIGGSAALADPAAEMPALLIALNATIIVVSVRGQREISADDFFLGIYETALEEDELIHSFRVPGAESKQRFGFYELARRHGDYAMAGVAISAQSVEPYSGLRIVFFSIGDHALRAHEAEAMLNGASVNDTDKLQLAQEALSGFEFYEDMNATADMKAHLARVVLKRALSELNKEAADA
jgi:carbon-monoxide dehydrogenase medium subunit